MGCVASRIDKEERVRICKERKRLMKHVVRFRGEFSEAQLEYLTSLKNTGVTLRQFTESESLELEDNPFGPALPPSPPPPLPPSPPPPPNFSPDLRKFGDNHKVEAAQEEILELDENKSCTPPPPPVPSSSWDFWDPFGTSSPQYKEKSETVNQVEEENWAEANTEFEEENLEEGTNSNNVVSLLPEKAHQIELLDDNSSMMSCHTKDTTDMAMVVSAGGKNVSVLFDINVVDTVLWQNYKENKSYLHI